MKENNSFNNIKINSTDSIPKTKKYSIIRSLKKYHEKEKIIPIITDFLNKTSTSENFFKTERQIIFGKTPRGPKFYKNSEIIPYSIVGPTNLYSLSKKFYKRSFTSNKIMTSVNSSNTGRRSRSRTNPSNNQKQNQKQQQQQTIIPIVSYDLIDENSLKSVYTDIKKRIKNSRTTIKKRKLKYPEFLEKSLKFQELVLNDNKKNISLSKKLQKILCNKSHKKGNYELLINKSNIFNFQLQEKNYKDKNLDDCSKYKDSLWRITLRNDEKNGKYDELGYRNIGTDLRPRFSYFNLDKIHEFAISNKNNEKIGRNKGGIKKYLNTISKMKIEGKNLLDVEMKREIGFKGKKILYKGDDLDLLLYKIKNKIPVIQNRADYFKDKCFFKRYEDNNLQISN